LELSKQIKIILFRITTNNKIDSGFHIDNISSDEIIEINDQSKMLWHRRLDHYYNDDITKYLKLHNIKTSKCFDCKIATKKN